MKTSVKVLSLVAKIAGVAVMLDWTSISPKFGALIFMLASVSKDAINRIGDFLDDGKSNGSFA